MNKLEIFMKRHSTAILSVVSGIGVVATTVLAVKATPKAVKLIEKAEEEKKEKLTPVEVVKVVWKPYIPTGLSMFATLTCIFGTHLLNQKTQASLVSAYAVLDKSYKEYIAKTEEMFGDEAKNVRHEVAKANYDSDLVHDEDKKLFFDYQTMRYFEATFEDVLNAEKRLNEEFAATGYVTVNDFYRFIGVDPLPQGNVLGWYDHGEYQELYFEHERMTLDDGLECILVIMDSVQLDYFHM